MREPVFGSVLGKRRRRVYCFALRTRLTTGELLLLLHAYRRRFSTLLMAFLQGVHLQKGIESEHGGQ
jgi:hypothetical protein